MRWVLGRIQAGIRDVRRRTPAVGGRHARSSRLNPLGTSLLGRFLVSEQLLCGNFFSVRWTEAADGRTIEFLVSASDSTWMKALFNVLASGGSDPARPFWFTGKGDQGGCECLDVAGRDKQRGVFRRRFPDAAQVARDKRSSTRSRFQGGTAERFFPEMGRDDGR